MLDSETASSNARTYNQQPIKYDGDSLIVLFRLCAIEPKPNENWFRSRYHFSTDIQTNVHRQLFERTSFRQCKQLFCTIHTQFTAREGKKVSTYVIPIMWKSFNFWLQLNCFFHCSWKVFQVICLSIAQFDGIFISSW